MEYIDKIVELVNLHKDDNDFLLGDLVCVLFDLLSIMRRNMDFDDEEDVLVSIFVPRDINKSECSYAKLLHLDDIKKCIDSGKIKKICSKDTISFGKYDYSGDYFMDMGRNVNISGSYVDEIEHCIKVYQWDYLCSHYIPNE